MESFKQIVALAADKAVAKKQFYISEKQSISYADLVVRLGKMMVLLEQYGIKSNDRILVSLSNDYDMFCVTLSLIVKGATAVIVEPDAKSRRAKIIIASSGIKGGILDKENISKWGLENQRFVIGLEKESAKKGVLLKKLLKKKEGTQEGETLDHLITSFDSSLTLPELSKEHQAVIIFTSGTSSSPKGVVLTHGNILAHLATLSSQYHIESDSVISNILSFYHADGLIQGAFLAFFNQVTLSRPFDFEVPRIEDLLHSIYKYKVSHFFSVPTMLNLINQFSADLRDSFDTEYFKFVVSNAGYLDEALWRSFMDNFNVRIVNAYGLTESVAAGLFCGPSDDSWRLGSIGKPVDVEVSVVDEKGNSVGNGEIGELLMRGDNIMKSYLISSENPDEHGWFHTGDLVSTDGDGFFFIKGRKKNVIIKGGINIYPEEIIETITLNEGISEAYVFGEPDEVWGEKVVAVLVKSSNAEVNRQESIEYCREHMQQINVPDEIHFIDQLPKGISGKVILEQVKAMVAEIEVENQNPEVASLQSKILGIANECFGTVIPEDHIHAPSHSIQGWNSLEHLHFATQIEKAFHIELGTRDIMNITSIASAISIVAKKISSLT